MEKDKSRKLRKREKMKERERVKGSWRIERLEKGREKKVGKRTGRKGEKEKVREIEIMEQQIKGTLRKEGRVI